MFASVGDALARIAPEATAVMIIRLIIKLVTHAIDDKDRWRRFMSLVVLLLAVSLTLAALALWWLLADGGVKLLLHDFGRT